MKIVGIIALTVGLTLGSLGLAFAHDHEDGPIVWTHGTPGACSMEQERGGPIEVCGTVFPGSTDASDHGPVIGR
jgi:hypothetical protein